MESKLTEKEEQAIDEFDKIESGEDIDKKETKPKIFNNPTQPFYNPYY
jgi:hypothetical protein